jgi:predicted nucleic acid-binding protein
MPLPERVLIDGSAFIALLSEDDASHNLAVQTYERLVDREQELWMTSSTLVRAAGLIRERFGIEGLRMFNDSIEGIVHVFWIGGATYQDALGLISDQFSGNNLGLEESLTFVVAKHLQAYVFTFNNCFSEVGIPTVPR